ncbi:MAG TPA: acetyl-CoA carboxylase, carboxyltransferase subunit beta [Thermomicrobiaceae bacterium]|nr:acetyl-CoA carboxylase, carboxyltransferase subunit beta [Thermomicrobiaceae bacterium]
MRELFRRQPRFTAEPQSQDSPAVPDDLWIKCPRCGELVYTREFERVHRVCPRCNYHGRLTARERLNLLTDPDSFVEWDGDLEAADPLAFVADGESYRDKICAVTRKSGAREALVTGSAAIGGHPVALAVAEFGFLGASMGSVFGEKLVRAIERAVDHGWALVTVSSAGGARMHEGPFSLLQMAKTTAALARLAEAGLAHLAVVADPCYGGVTASYVTVADVILAEPGAMIGFAGPRVIEQITRQKLPEGFQTAEFLLAHGMIDLIVPRRGLSGQLATLLGHYAAAPVRVAAAVVRETSGA